MRVKKKRVLLLQVFIGVIILFLCIQMGILQTKNGLDLTSFLWNKLLIVKAVVKQKDEKMVELRRVLLKKLHSKANIGTRAIENAKKIMKNKTESLKNNKEYEKATSKQKEISNVQRTQLTFNETIDSNKLGTDNKVSVKLSTDHRSQPGNNFDSVRGNKKTNASESTMSSKFLSTWRIWNSMVKQRNLTPIRDQGKKLKTILNAMKNAKIISADVGYGGTALKVSLILEGEQEVVFRPKR